MDNANKIVSFVLGLVVVIVFLAVFTGRLNIKNLKISPLVKSTTPTPKVSVTPTPTSTQNVISEVSTSNGKVTKIPATGAPIEILPLILSGLFGGIYLKKKSS